MNIAVICARKNSKRVKNKNFLLINKKPLIDFTVETALKSKIFDKIIINTDNRKYKTIKSKNKILVYQRPKKLGNSKTRVLEVLKEMFKKISFKMNDNIFILFPTSPLRSVKDIINANKIFNKYKQKKQIISVTEYLPSIDVAFFIKKNNTLKNKFLKKYNTSPGNNNHDKYYYCNYAIIINQLRKIKNSQKLINENSIPYIMPFDRSIDIDENSQLKVVKKILNK